jgi:diadenosine tetraphosphate (Ap4A) HIT family hydrolase
MSESAQNPCPFCSLNESDILLRAEHAVAFYDGFPVNPGHVLVIPKRHEANFFELTHEEREDLFRLLTKAMKLITEKHSPDAFNVGINIGEAAGQTVYHTHVHLIPRYDGDVPDPRGGVRGVIPHKQQY